jgi:hypothetical protein
MRAAAVTLIMVAGCVEHQEAKDFYDHTQTGTTWELTIRDGVREDSYPGPCPVFAPRTRYVPDAASAPCDPGCACSFAFDLEEGGDVAVHYSVNADYRQACQDGSVLQCTEPSPESVETGWCTWVSGTVAPGQGSFGDCKYAFDVTEQ